MSPIQKSTPASKSQALLKIFKKPEKTEKERKYSVPISPASQPLVTAAAQNCQKLIEAPNETKSKVLHKVFHPTKFLPPVPKLENEGTDEWSLKDHPSWEIMFNILEPKVASSCAPEQKPEEKKLKDYIRLRREVLKLQDDLFGIGRSPPMMEQHCQCCLKNPANSYKL